MKKRYCMRFLAAFMFFFVVQSMLFSDFTLAATTYNDILPPSNLAFQLTTPKDVKLTWSSVYGATGYNVYGITEGQLKVLGTTTSTSYVFNNLQEGSYTYVVSTLSSTGESGPCAPIVVDIVYPVMAAPATLTNAIKNGNDIVLSWAASQYAQSYNIYEISSDNQKTLLTTVTGLTYTISNAAEASYTYAVTAVNSTYGESSLSNYLQVDLVYPVMKAPGNATYKIQNGKDIVLSWGAVTYATAYKVYQVIDGQNVLKNTVTGTSTSITDLSSGNYIYEVYSYSDRFGESPDGSQVSITLGDVIMTPPSNFTYTINNGNDIALSWNSVPNAASYKIYLISNGQKVLKSTVTGTTVTYANMPEGNYTYEIHSYSSTYGESAEGSQIVFTFTDPIMIAPTNLVQIIKNATDFTLTWDASPYANSYKVYQIVNGSKVLKNTVTTATVSYSNMAPGEYTYEVYSYSTRFGESVEGSTVVVTLNGQTMQPPTGLTYSIANYNDITLKWTASAYATSYKIYQVIDGQNVLMKTVTTTSTTLTNLPSGNYDFVVTSVSTLFGESPSGAEITFSLDLPTMEVPGNLKYTIQNGTSVVLTWNAVTYANNYKVYELINGQKVLKATVTSLTTTISNVSAGDHTYIVTSVNTRFGESQEESQVSLTIAQQMLPPTNLSYSIANGNDITLKWTAASFAGSYQIYQVVDGQKILKKTVTTTSVTFTNMPAGDYDYIITSVSTVFGESSDGAAIALTVVYPTMTAPTNLTYKLQNANSVVLTWNAVTYATSYKVYELIDGQEVLKATVTSPSATISNLSVGDHTYIVHSVSSRFGESQEGSQVSLTLAWQMQAPTNLTYSITNGNDITLKWTAATYANSYRIYQVIDGQMQLIKTVTTTSTTFTNSPAGYYEYVITSVSSVYGESADGAEISFPLVFPDMAAPSSLTQSITNGNDITLRWSAVTYATAYNVYQVIDGQKTLLKTLTGTNISFTNMPEGYYTYEVNSFSSRFGESAEGCTINFDLVWPVVQPPILTDTIYNVNNITLSWKAATWANEYRLYEIKDGARQIIYKGTALSYSVYNVSEDTHSYEVTAYSTRFGESDASNRITETIIYPEMQSPIANLKLIDSTTALISWNFVTYANGYNVYEIVDGKPVLLIEKLNNLSYQVNNLSYADHLFYVTAYSNSFGESQPSNTVIAKLIIDTKAPVTTSDAPIGWVNHNPVVVHLSAVDDITGVANTYHSINGSDFIEGTSITVDKEGMNEISFYSVDKVGNKEDIKTINVKIDTTAPITTTDAPKNWSKEDVTVNLSAVDELSGVVKTFYSIDGSDYVEGTTFTVKEEGFHQISFYSVDAAGNVEAVDTIEVKLDKTAPVVLMNLDEEYELGSTLKLSYAAEDNLSGIVNEKMLVFDPNDTVGKVVENNTDLHIDKPGIYNITVTVTDAAGLTTTIHKQFTLTLLQITAEIEVTPKVIKGNKGVFTVRVSLPAGFDTQDFDLNTATLNGVNALTSNNGYYNQAKLGQFKFERSDFNWIPSDHMVVEFRCYVNGYLVVGKTTVKVQK